MSGHGQVNQAIVWGPVEIKGKWLFFNIFCSDNKIPLNLLRPYIVHQQHLAMPRKAALLWLLVHMAALLFANLGRSPKQDKTELKGAC